jgi:hypothetical protein
MMTMEADWIKMVLSGALVVATFAFPALFFPRWHFLLRLIGACITVAVGLGLFGALMGHQFDFLRPEDIPPLGIGWGSGC